MIRQDSLINEVTNANKSWKNNDDKFSTHQKQSRISDDPRVPITRSQLKQVTMSCSTVLKHMEDVRKHSIGHPVTFYVSNHNSNVK